MEYRRRRRGKSGSSGAGLRALSLIVIFGALAYLIFGTGLGKRIKDGWADTLIGGCRGSAAPLPTVSALFTPQPTAAPTVAPTGVTCGVSLPALELYLLRMSVFDSRDTAYLAAATLRGMGAAEYVYEDGGFYSPIAAAYSDAASAESVCTRLAYDGHDCSVLALSYPGAELMITADASRLVPIRTAFTLAPDVPAQLEELSLEFDAESKSVEYAVSVLAEIETNIRSALSGIADSSALNPTLYSVDEYFNDILAFIDGAMGKTGSRADFASALKTLFVEAALRYAALLGGVGSAE
jgi:hypothetical protein